MGRAFQIQRRGFTLIELTIVVLVLALLSVVALGRYARVAETAKVAAAEADLRTLRDAFVDPAQGYLRDMAGIPGFSCAYLRVGNLFVATNVFGTKVVSGLPQNTQTRGIRVDEGTDAVCAAEGRARPSAFTSWDAVRARGWRGPYVKASTGFFPAKDARRDADDAPFGARGFFPELSHLRLPHAFKDDARASVYGFVDEPTLLDPWGNPYVLQIPPPQAFPGVTNVSDLTRFAYARVVSAGPDGVLDTPCFGANGTNWWATAWNETRRRLARQAGLIDATNRVARGDDLVLFLSRNDVDEGREEP